MNTTTTPTKYIAYYRVSTTKQGESGLGLEAQRAAVRLYMSAQEGAELAFEFTGLALTAPWSKLRQTWRADSWSNYQCGAARLYSFREIELSTAALSRTADL